MAGVFWCLNLVKAWNLKDTLHHEKGLVTNLWLWKDLRDQKRGPLGNIFVELQVKAHDYSNYQSTIFRLTLSLLNTVRKQKLDASTDKKINYFACDWPHTAGLEPSYVLSSVNGQNVIYFCQFFDRRCVNDVTYDTHLCDIYHALYVFDVKYVP